MLQRIKQSKIKLGELKRLQRQFFNEQDRKLKKQYSAQIEKIEWDLIEETLNEQGNEKAIAKLYEYKKSRSKPFFIWKLYFAEVFQRENPGFDIVIANPPYVEFKNLNKAEKNRIERNYTTTSGKYDLYIPFLEKSADISRSSGFIVFICPTRFMHRDYGKGIRQFIRNNYTIREIIDFSDIQMFEGTLNYTGLFSFLNVSTDNYQFLVKKFTGVLQGEGLFRSLHSKSNEGNLTSSKHDSKSLSDGPWYFHADTKKVILDKVISGSVPLCELVEGIFQGIATGKDEVFIISDEMATKQALEKKYLQQFLMGKDIGRYRINWRKKFLIYTYDDNGHVIGEQTLRQKAPSIYKYLKSCRPKLSGRAYFDNSSKLWYELWNQRNLKRFKQAKIITLDNARKNSFTFDETGYLGSTTMYSIILKDKSRIHYLFVLGLLNSSLLEYFHKSNTIPQAGGFYRYQALFIDKLPIIKASTEEQNRIAKLVDNILELSRNVHFAEDLQLQIKTKELEKEIDLLVYGLSRLTEDDIKVVERGLHVATND